MGKKRIDSDISNLKMFWIKNYRHQLECRWLNRVSVISLCHFVDCKRNKIERTNKTWREECVPCSAHYSKVTGIKLAMYPLKWSNQVIYVLLDINNVHYMQNVTLYLTDIYNNKKFENIGYNKTLYSTPLPWKFSFEVLRLLICWLRMWVCCLLFWQSADSVSCISLSFSACLFVRRSFGRSVSQSVNQ